MGATTTYGVKAAAQITGVNPHTLRIWERRYGLVKPARTATGRRVYGQGDIDKLCLVAFLVAKGHAISQLATLSQAGLQRAVAAARRVAAGDGSPALAAIDAQALTELIETLTAFHLRELDARIAAARARMRISDFVFQIVSPLLAEIGRQVAEGRLTIAHEHALSAILKTHIYQLLQLAPASVGSSRGKAAPAAVVVATMAGDFHELGILLASLLLAVRGVPVHFFGANMPAEPLARAANALRSRIVLIGKTVSGAIRVVGDELTLRAYLRDLDRDLHRDTAIWLGGHADGVRLRTQRSLVLLPTLVDLDRRLDVRG